MGIVGSLVVMVVGLALLIWRRFFADLVVSSQNRMWGFRFGDRERRISIFVAIIVGIGFLGMGILTLSGIIHWKT
jgi:hypothetical protein